MDVDSNSRETCLYHIYLSNEIAFLFVLNQLIYTPDRAAVFHILDYIPFRVPSVYVHLSLRHIKQLCKSLY
jgi:hypothetical protein